MTCRALIWAERSMWAWWLLATIIRPDVSLSNRWTMPGRISPPMPWISGHIASKALTRVWSGWPGPGWTANPAGLSITTKSSSW